MTNCQRPFDGFTIEPCSRETDRSMVHESSQRPARTQYTDCSLFSYLPSTPSRPPSLVALASVLPLVQSTTRPRTHLHVRLHLIPSVLVPSLLDLTLARQTTRSQRPILATACTPSHPSSSPSLPSRPRLERSQPTRPSPSCIPPRSARSEAPSTALPSLDSSPPTTASITVSPTFFIRYRIEIDDSSSRRWSTRDRLPSLVRQLCRTRDLHLWILRRESHRRRIKTSTHFFPSFPERLLRWILVLYCYPGMRTDAKRHLQLWIARNRLQHGERSPILCCRDVQRLLVPEWIHPRHGCLHELRLRVVDGQLWSARPGLHPSRRSCVGHLPRRYLPGQGLQHGIHRIDE
jgi:hypothetical protein